MVLVSVLTKFANFLFGARYHPERHYMRGPGPACQRALAPAQVRRR
jgi:hypothetical protein